MLRELFEEWAAGKHITQSFYALVKALVEAVEPEEMPSAEEYNDARDARIRFLQDALAEAKSDWARVSTDCHELKIKLEKPRTELAEAKAEIERLRHHVANWDTDAEVGQLVRGMRPHTALLKTETTYWGQIAQTRMEWSTADQPWFETDPAKALRAIQEVEDDEA